MATPDVKENIRDARSGKLALPYIHWCHLLCIRKWILNPHKRRGLPENDGKYGFAHPCDDIAVLCDDIAALRDNIAVLRGDSAVLRDDIAVHRDAIAGLHNGTAAIHNGFAYLKYKEFLAKGRAVH